MSGRCDGPSGCGCTVGALWVPSLVGTSHAGLMYVSTADLIRDAAWVLVVAFVVSIAYELYRATIRAGDSRYDSTRAFVEQLPVYTAATAVIVVLFTGEDWAAWIGLTFCVVAILVSIFYYNPRILPARRPGLLDWLEDLAFTGLLFVAATQLIYAIGHR